VKILIDQEGMIFERWRKKKEKSQGVADAEARSKTDNPFQSATLSPQGAGSEMGEIERAMGGWREIRFQKTHRQ